MDQHGGPHELTALRALEREHLAGAERPRIEELLAGVRAARAADAAEQGLDTPCQSGAVLHLGPGRHPLAQGTPRAVVLVAIGVAPGVPLCIGCARFAATQVIDDAGPRAGTRHVGSITVVPLPGTDLPRIVERPASAGDPATAAGR